MQLKRRLFFWLLFFIAYGVKAQKLEKQKNYFLSAIGFWNVENLYDTLNDRWKNDEEFTPEGHSAWTGERYRNKIEHLAEAIHSMATDITPDGLAIMGLCEVENKKVVQDLVNAPLLKPRNYRVVHIEGPDARGIDPALIYNPAYFKVLKTVSYRVKLPADSMHKTRDILVVSGTLLDEKVALLVNHWPSRRGGETASRPNRNAAAKMAKRIADSIARTDPGTKIMIMGDLNDDPVDVSVKVYIGTYGNIHLARDSAYFNPMEKLYQDGIGTLAWQDSWNLFDQILLSPQWIPSSYATWQYHSVRVFNKPFLTNPSGRYKGSPFRTYTRGRYTGGYSDHFPVYVIIAKEKKQ